jgi:hypothetical protein
VLISNDRELVQQRCDDRNALLFLTWYEEPLPPRDLLIGQAKLPEGGLGLGLSIVRHLVELHEGVVTAESDGKGTGATFVVQLPLISTKFEAAQMAVEEPERSEPASTRLLKGLWVLMVDDDASSRELVARILSEFGVEVTAVGSADEALDNLRGKTWNKRINRRIC